MPWTTNKNIVIAGIPGTVHIWSNASGEPVATLDEHGNLGLLGNVYQNGPMSIKVKVE